MAQAQPPAAPSGQGSQYSTVRPWSSNLKHTDRERWICIYPAYINSRKTVNEGRRLPKAKCVENPTAHEIKDVLISTGLLLGVEKKVYPRELDHRDPKVIGRIRVQLRDENGGLMKEEFQSRKAVLEYISDKIPKLKTRQQGASQQTTTQVQTSTKSKKGRKGK